MNNKPDEITKTMVAFDIDGVLRDLNGVLADRYDVPLPTKWHWKYQGKSIFDYIRKDYSVLVEAKPTKYFNAVMDLYKDAPIELWSCQPPDWKPFVIEWLQAQGVKKYLLYYLNTKQKRDRLDKHTNYFLVEDCPNYSNYDRIVLIDTPYNREVECSIRVKTEKKLVEVLGSLGVGDGKD